MSTSKAAEAATRFLQEQGVSGAFVAAVIIPSRIIRVADDLSEAIAIPYMDIPGFPEISISGEPGRVISGRLSGKKILVFEGRPQMHETGDASEMRVIFETIANLQISVAVLSGFAGSLNPDWGRGGICAVRDHINITGRNPLMGDTSPERSVSMVNAYDPSLRRLFKLAAGDCGVTLNEGVLMWFPGPSFETPAEVKMAKAMGADIVGMSIVPEVILARRFNLQVAALAAISNMGAGLAGKSVHGEGNEATLAAAVGIRRLIGAMMKAL